MEDRANGLQGPAAGLAISAIKVRHFGDGPSSQARSLTDNASTVGSTE
jgi:hypothetical protein